MSEVRHKRGDVRKDGMVFQGYAKGCLKGEWWVTPKKFAEIRARYNARRRERYSNDPQYREKQLAGKKTRVCRDREAELRRTPEGHKKAAEYIRKRRLKDPVFAALCRTRARTRSAFNRLSADKPTNTEALLGTDWKSLKAHIESLFVGEMSWENMSDWHIDHIIPLASAKTEEELATLCHYTNLQPLWASDNMRKGAKLPHELNN